MAGAGFYTNAKLKHKWEQLLSLNQANEKSFGRAFKFFSSFSAVLPLKQSFSRTLPGKLAGM